MVVEEIGKLDEKYSKVLLYKYKLDFSTKTISKLMDIPEKTVYTRINRGKKLLLEALKEEI